MSQLRRRHQQTLTLATLGELAGGEAEAVVNAALRAALRDTEDRGEDKKARKVTIVVELKKVGDGHVSATLQAKTTLPNYQTNTTIGELKPDERGHPVMNFGPHAPLNPDQPPLDGTT